jgi:probable rRNA maturation factor
MSKLVDENPFAPVEVSVVLLNDSQILRYNRDYRNKDYPTDVLSFPVKEMQDEISSGHRRRIFYLGDILISMERTAHQALEKKHPLQTELKILLSHGFLHLIGFDHETDSGQMERLEKRIRRDLR